MLFFFADVLLFVRCGRNLRPLWNFRSVSCTGPRKGNFPTFLLLNNEYPNVFIYCGYSTHFSNGLSLIPFEFSEKNSAMFLVQTIWTLMVLLCEKSTRISYNRLIFPYCECNLSTAIVKRYRYRLAPALQQNSILRIPMTYIGLFKVVVLV